MKSVCLYFKIHQPFRLKRYRFFDIGNDHFYYDDAANDEIITRIAQQSYIPTARVLLELLNRTDYDFRCAIAISGTAMDQLQNYVPECIELLRKLADTGRVEFLASTFSHGLSSLQDPAVFEQQVSKHRSDVKRLFGVESKVIYNTELIFDDDIALMMRSMGYEAAVTEGAKHILGWKSPNFLYRSATAQSLGLLLVNDKLTEDIALNFNNPGWHEYPLTADKYIDWIASLPEDQQVVNIFLNMETIGSFLPRETGIFEFLKALPYFASQRGVKFTTPSDVVARLKPVDALSIPYPLSGTDEARDVSAWRGNTMQREALDKLYSLAGRIGGCTEPLKQDWLYLQSSDHFYYMSTKNLADGEAHASFSPYESPFDAFTNYMNVLADFTARVNVQVSEDMGKEEVDPLLLIIRNQTAEIEQLKKELETLRTNAANDADAPKPAAKAKPAAKPKAAAGKRKKQ